MLKNIPYVALYVTDQDKALAFYTNLVGLQKRLDVPTPAGPRFISVGVEGDPVALLLWPGTPGRGAPVQGIVPAQYTIETTNCRDMYETLRARGVEFDTPVLEHPWGYNAIFHDADGNRLQLREGKR